MTFLTNILYFILARLLEPSTYAALVALVLAAVVLPEPLAVTLETVLTYLGVVLAAMIPEVGSPENPDPDDSKIATMKANLNRSRKRH